MKKVNLPILIQDKAAIDREEIDKYIEGYNCERDYFLDGPVSLRVAIVDLDPETGEVVTGARINYDNKIGRYLDPDGAIIRDYEKDGYLVEGAFSDDDKRIYFMKTSVFATVMKTIDLIEKKDNLGHKIQWAFDGKQLLVIPRAGEMANAFYHRNSHSLQFFYFNNDKGKRIYSCMSRDIVAHETAHAIIDSIAPTLVNAIDPHALAIHEAVADLTAVLLAFESKPLRKLVFTENDYRIHNVSHFTTIAEEFAEGRGHGEGLRNLLNDRNLISGHPDEVLNNEPHDLSEVLSGAIYAVMVKAHDKIKDLEVNKGVKSEEAAHRSIGKIHIYFRQLLFRALDYLPPGEIAFHDYVVSMFAVLKMDVPRAMRIHSYLLDEFKFRGIVEKEETEKDFEKNYKCNFEFKPQVLEDILTSDWAAYHFIDKNRFLFHLPAQADFKVYPRIKAEKEIEGRNGRVKRNEIIFKVSWTASEKNKLGSKKYGDRRELIVGTSLIINYATKKVMARFTNRNCTRNAVDVERRNSFLKKLIEEEKLDLSNTVMDQQGQMNATATIQDGQLKVQGTMNLLHICKNH